MKIKFNTLILFFIYLSMSCNETKFHDFSVSDFTEDYVGIHTNKFDLTSITIRNPNWTIYPPNNEMPINAFYYTVPRFIKDFKNLQILNLNGIFLEELPEELKDLSDLRHLTFSLGTKSNIDSICGVLQQIRSLETLNLTGSVISDSTFNNVKQILPNVQIIDVIRSMQNRKSGR